MGRFNRQAAAPQTPEMKYNAARSNLLLVVVFTAVNLVLQVVGSSLYFLFSASVPLFLAEMGAVMSEALPALYVVGIVAALAGIGIYLVCYFLAKKHRGWLIAALVLFAIDTVMLFLLYEITADMVLDVLFHAWVLYYLIVGVKNSGKLGQQPEMPMEAYPVEPQQPVMMVNGEPVAQDADTE